MKIALEPKSEVLSWFFFTSMNMIIWLICIIFIFIYVTTTDWGRDDGKYIVILILNDDTEIAIIIYVDELTLF